MRFRKKRLLTRLKRNFVNHSSGFLPIYVTPFSFTYLPTLEVVAGMVRPICFAALSRFLILKCRLFIHYLPIQIRGSGQSCRRLYQFWGERRRRRQRCSPRHRQRCWPRPRRRQRCSPHHRPSPGQPGSSTPSTSHKLVPGEQVVK